MASAPYSVLSRPFWRAYGITLRPYLLFVSGVSGLVGLATVEGSWLRIVAASAAFFLSYGLGQAITDVSQTDTDAISSPYRPLTQNLITVRQVTRVSLLGLLACTAVFAACNLRNLPLGLLAVIGLVLYTPAKRRWYLGPFWNAWIVALLPIMGALCGAGRLGLAQLGPVQLAAATSVFFGYASFVLAGYLKDVDADRRTGYRTIPVVFGWNAAVYVSAAFLVLTAAAAIVVLALAYAAGHDRAVAAAALLAAVAIVVNARAHLGLLRIKDERLAHLPLLGVLRSYIWLHLAEAIAWRPAVGFIAPLVIAAFELALARRPEPTQL